MVGVGVPPAILFLADYADYAEHPGSRMIKDPNSITRDIIGSALRIHTAIGPGIFESVYRTILADDLRRKGYFVEMEKEVPIVFEGRRFERAFRADILVQNSILVEAKSVADLAPVHFTQVVTYLRLLDLRIGLLLNFGSKSLTIRRVAN